MLWSVYISVGLFFALLGGLVVGRRLGEWMRGPDGEGGGSVAADGVVFAVLGLLIAFTFTTSASKFDDRRKLIVEQANALGTANLRLDVLEPDDQRAVRERLAEWVDLALTTKEFSTDPERLRTALVEADRIQNEAWRLAVAAVDRKQQPALNAFVLAPLNEWIDLTTTRVAMDDLGLPPMVLPTLAVLSLVASVLADLGMKRRSGRDTLHMLAFAGAVAFSIYVILDLNHPRLGLIKVTGVDQIMIELNRNFERQLSNTEQP